MILSITVIVFIFLTNGITYAENSSAKNYYSGLSIFPTTDNLSDYFTDPDVPVEISGMTEEEAEEMKESFMRDSWYFTFKLGTNLQLDPDNFRVGPELVFNFFRHVGIGAGASYHIIADSDDIKGAEYTYLYYLSYYLTAKIYYHPPESISTPYITLNYGKCLGEASGVDEVDYTGFDSEYDYIEFETGKYYGLGIGYIFSNEWQVELLLVYYKNNVFVEHYDESNGIDISEAIQYKSKQFIISIAYNF